MHGKDFLKSSLMCFFIIVSCVNVAAYIIGSKFDSGANLTYEVLLFPIFFGVCGSLPNVLMYSRHELSGKEIIVRKILQLILLEALLYFISFGGNDTISADKHTAIAFMVGVFLVFIVVHVVTYVIDLGIARAMNLDLKEFQKRNS